MIKVACAVTTLGRTAGLERLLNTVPDHVPVLIAWQGDQESMASFAIGYERRPNIRLQLSAGGASRGRNDAVELAPADTTHLLFPNDDTFYPPQFFDRAEACLEDVSVGAFLVHANDAGQAIRAGLTNWNAAGQSYLIRSLRAAHEPGLIVAMNVFKRIGGFNADLGVGSPGSYQSGEGTDFVLRAARYGDFVSDLSGTLHALEDGREVGEEALAKRLRYAPGTAFLLGMHAKDYQVWSVFFQLVVGTCVRSGSLRPVPSLLKSFREGLQSENLHSS